MGFVNPRQIINEHLELKRNMIAADFGCGSGEWAVALAEALELGKVYAIDLLDEPLSSVRSKAKIAGLENVEAVKGDIEKLVTRLLANSLDLVLMTNLLFQANDRAAIFGEAARVAKSGGKALVVDWKPEARLGPENKISADEVKNLAQAAGFLPVKEFAAGNFHYGVIFQKQ